MVTAVYVVNDSDFEFDCTPQSHCEFNVDVKSLWRLRATMIRRRQKAKILLAEFDREDVFPETARFFATIVLEAKMNGEVTARSSLSGVSGHSHEKWTNISAHEKITNDEKTNHEYPEKLLLKLMFDSGSMKSTMHYGIASIPSYRCTQSCWKTKREKNFARWIAYGYEFQISYKSYFTGGDSDVEFTIKQIKVANLKELKPGKNDVEEVWENQRKSKNVFSGAFLSTADLPEWSTFEGEARNELSKLYLSSLAYEWKGEWIVSGIDDGWMYAENFDDSVWTATSTANSMVRRRKWIRHKQLKAQSKEKTELVGTSGHIDTNQTDFIKKGRNDREKLEIILSSGQSAKFKDLLEFDYYKKKLG